MDIKTLTGSDIENPKVLVEAMNSIFKEYRDAIAGLTPKDELEKVNAKLIVEANGLKDLIMKQGTAFDEHKKVIASLTETLQIQGDTITKMRTAFNPTNEKKSFAKLVDECLLQPEFKNFASGNSTKAKFAIETKDVAFTGTYGSGAVGQPFMPFQVPQLPPAESFDARLILPTGTINSSSLEYPTERAASLSNAMTHEAENAAANESTMGFTMGTAYATRISTFIEISRSALQNSAWLNQYISNRLMQMFVAKLNTSTIAGAGSAAGMAGDNDLKGLLAFANTFAGTNFASKIANANRFDVLNCAKGEMNGLYNIVANSYLINPYDGTILTSSKNTISDFVAPATFLQPTATGYNGAFGMRQIESADVTLDAYLIAAIAPQYMQLLFNGPIEILMTDAHASNFIADLVTIKLEAKVLLPVYNANALMKGTLSADLATIALS